MIEIRDPIAGEATPGIGANYDRAVAFSRVGRFGFVNCYLVDEEDGLTLIDSMLPGSATGILACAEQHGKPIVRILLTHAHGDHVGSVDKLHEAVPGAAVMISVRDARLLDKDVSLDPGEAQVKIRGGVPGTETKPTRTIEAGDRVGSLEAIAAPGHTPGHFAFLDTRDGTLFCGDAYASWGGTVATCANASWRFKPVQLATWHKPTALESAKALRALNPKRLAPGHGKVIEDPGKAMDRAVAKGL
jgi:glyoxylase-like metal-dependent hydrolase (beta-lactamase superfamily II)